MTVPKEFFPEPEILLSLAPEELASHLLIYLKHVENNGGRLHQGNLINPGNMRDLDASRSIQISHALAEAWAWLASEGLIAQDPQRALGWSFITRRGESVKSRSDFEAMQKAALLPRKLIHPILVDKVLPNFIRGDYDTAVFQSFKQVEVAVRNAGKFRRMITERRLCAKPSILKPVL